jgi:hypothetical protein
MLYVCVDSTEEFGLFDSNSQIPPFETNIVNMPHLKINKFFKYHTLKYIWFENFLLLSLVTHDETLMHVFFMTDMEIL